MISSLLAQVEAAFRDAPLSLSEATPQVYYSLRLHQINAFGYREEWAEALLGFVRFNRRNQPHFPVSPETPEAHRHKFLCALALSEGSPGRWQNGDRSFQSSDFVEAILQSPVEEWGDRSMVPEPSWTLQFLSACLDQAGEWAGRTTPLEAVAKKYWEIYFQDFESGELWHPGRTPFTETGLHFLEALNKLCQRQGRLFPGLFPKLKLHVRERLTKALEDSRILLANPAWVESKNRARVLEIAISQLLILGHLMELSFHPQGALRRAWDSPERKDLKGAIQTLAELMNIFFDPRLLGIMDQEQKRLYPFPMLHAYHALTLQP